MRSLSGAKSCSVAGKQERGDRRACGRWQVLTPFQVSAKQAPADQRRSDGVCHTAWPALRGVQKQGLFHLKPVLKIIIFFFREGRVPAPESKKRKKDPVLSFLEYSEINRSQNKTRRARADKPRLSSMKIPWINKDIAASRGRNTYVWLKNKQREELIVVSTKFSFWTGHLHQRGLLRRDLAFLGTSRVLWRHSSPNHLRCPCQFL